MQSETLSDEQKRELIDEFNDPETSEFRKMYVAQRLLQDIMQKECPRLILRARNGEQLSDRELSLLSYKGDIDENIEKEFFKRRISDLARKKYVSEYLEERARKQIAILAIKDGFFARITESAFIQPVLQAAAKGSDHIGKFLDLQSSCLTLNFEISGCLLFLDISYSLFLYCKGKITLTGLKKRVSSSVTSTVFGIGGFQAGTALGALIGGLLSPIGAIVGGMIGGVIGGFTFALFGKLLNDKLWEYIGHDEEKAREELLKSARDVLGVVEASDFRTVTRQWRKMVLEYHPDKHPDANEEERRRFAFKFQEVHTSYNIIREEFKRQGELEQSEIEEISKSTAVLVINDGWLEDD